MVKINFAEIANTKGDFSIPSSMFLVGVDDR